MNVHTTRAKTALSETLRLEQTLVVAEHRFRSYCMYIKPVLTG